MAPLRAGSTAVEKTARFMRGDYGASETKCKSLLLPQLVVVINMHSLALLTVMIFGNRVQVPGHRNFPCRWMAESAASSSVSHGEFDPGFREEHLRIEADNPINQ